MDMMMPDMDGYIPKPIDFEMLTGQISILTASS
jgi:hypothetical protein